MTHLTVGVAEQHVVVMTFAAMMAGARRHERQQHADPVGADGRCRHQRGVHQRSSENCLSYPRVACRPVSRRLLVSVLDSVDVAVGMRDGSVEIGEEMVLVGEPIDGADLLQNP